MVWVLDGVLERDRLRAGQVERWRDVSGKMVDGMESDGVSCLVMWTDGGWKLMKEGRREGSKWKERW